MKNSQRRLVGFKTFAALALSSAGVSSLQAQVLRLYTGGDTTTWSDTASWAGLAVPDPGDDVSLRNSAGTNTFDLATPFTLRTLAVASRTLDASSTNVTTTIDLNAGVRNFANVVVGEESGNAAATAGSLTLSYGTVNISTLLQVGRKSTTGTGDPTGTVTGTSNLTFNSTGNIEVGVNSGSANGAVATGTLDMTTVAAGTISIASGGSLKVGSTTSGTGVSGTGTVTLGNNWTSTALGTDTSNRAIIEIGRKTNNGPGTGSFTQTGGTFNAFLSTLDVGHSTVGNGSAVIGTLTLVGTRPTIDTTILNIGNATGGVGVVTLGNNATLTVGGGNVNVANGPSIATASQLTFGTGGNFAVGGLGNIVIGRANVNGTTSTGSVSLGSTTTTLGTSVDRVAALSIGTRTANTSGLSSGSLTQTGGNFTGYFTSLNVGQVTNGTTGLNTATLDFTGVGTLLIDVSGTTNIGRGRNAAGSVTTGLGVSKSGATNIGDPLGDVTGASLNLNKTAFTSGITASTGNLLVDALGQINATVGTNNAGINQGGITLINQATTALAINSFTNSNNEGVQFTFENFNTSLWELGDSSNFGAIYYALKWQGVDRTAAINTLITANKISANTSAISGAPAAQVFTQGGDTYYGFYLKTASGSPTFSISGTVTLNGGGLAGVTVSDGTRTANTNGSGVYTITNAPDSATYTVTPSFTGYTFTPASSPVTLSGANMTGVNFSVANTFGNWATMKGLTGLNALPGANPSGDGVKNLVKYALDLNPLVSTVPPGTYTGNLLTFTKGLMAKADSKIQYSIEESTELTTWTAPDGIAPNGTVVNGADTITYTFVSGQPKRFARLKVVQIP